MKPIDWGVESVILAANHESFVIQLLLLSEAHNLLAASRICSCACADKTESGWSDVHVSLSMFTSSIRRFLFLKRSHALWYP